MLLPRVVRAFQAEGGVQRPDRNSGSIFEVRKRVSLARDNKEGGGGVEGDGVKEPARARSPVALCTR